MSRWALPLLALAILVAPEVQAKRKAALVKKTPTVKTVVESKYRKTPYVGAIAVNAANSNVIFEANAQVAAYPASVTKLMTALIVLEDVKRGKYRLDDKVTATADVNRCEPSWVGLKVGDQMSVRDLLTALMVESANDAAIALGVHSAGSLEAFTVQMNDRARELGMVQTTYYNPNGLPPNGRKYPWRNFNVTTAADQSKLALALVNDNPEILDFTSVKTCDLVKTAWGYRIGVTRKANVAQVMQTELKEGEKIIKSFSNHNRILRMDKFKIMNPNGSEAVDGLKTGYINAGGSSIVLTAKRNGKRAIVIVLGSSSADVREEAARKIMLDALGALSW